MRTYANESNLLNLVIEALGLISRKASRHWGFVASLELESGN